MSSIGRHFVLGLSLLAVLGVARPVAAADHLRGIDVSHWQGKIDWDKVKKSGVVFAFVKATEGLTYKDPEFAHNWAEMKRVGLIRGAYHFGRPGKDPVKQAEHFVAVVKPIKGDLQLCLDLEANDGKTPAQVWDWTQKFVAEIKRKTGRAPIIYTGPSFWKDKVGNPTKNLDCPLWVAHWTTDKEPTVPRAWQTWSFWQYSAKGSVPGIKGNVDVDYWHGSLDRLKKLRLP